jgi:hypothetical protein
MSEFELRRRLRTLARERAPGRDLWSGIEARLQGPARRTAIGHGARYAWSALAAGMVLAIGTVLVLRDIPGGSRAPHAGAPWVVREAQAMDAAFRGAQEGSGPPLADAHSPPEWAAAGTELDAAQRELELALGQNPDSVFLLNRLKHTHEQRLRLLRRRAELS